MASRLDSCIVPLDPGSGQQPVKEHLEEDYGEPEAHHDQHEKPAPGALLLFHLARLPFPFEINQPHGDDFGNARPFHSDAVQGVCHFHGAALVGDADELDISGL